MKKHNVRSLGSLFKISRVNVSKHRLSVTAVPPSQMTAHDESSEFSCRDGEKLLARMILYDRKCSPPSSSKFRIPGIRTDRRSLPSRSPFWRSVEVLRLTVGRRTVRWRSDAAGVDCRAKIRGALHLFRNRDIVGHVTVC